MRECVSEWLRVGERCGSVRRIQVIQQPTLAALSAWNDDPNFKKRKFPVRSSAMGGVGMRGSSAKHLREERKESPRERQGERERKRNREREKEGGDE